MITGKALHAALLRETKNHIEFQFLHWAAEEGVTA